MTEIKESVKNIIATQDAKIDNKIKEEIHITPL